MKQINTIDAVGCVLCHDLTQIIKDEYKGARFKKGHVVRKEDIEVLLSMGKEHLYVFEKKEGFLHEDEAAERLLELAASYNIGRGECREGKIELFAKERGLFCFDTQKLRQINSIGEITIAARSNNYPVEEGDKLAGMRAVPLIIDEQKIIKAEEITRGSPLFSIKTYKPIKFGIVATGSEIKNGTINDTFSPVVAEKLSYFGGVSLGVLYPGDDKAVIANAITQFCDKGAELIACTGGMSVDPDDKTPAAIKYAGACVVSYGAPVLPGAMFLYGHLPEGQTVIGLPGCVMYAKRTVLDLVLPRIFTGEILTSQQLAAMGDGGFCLSCEKCVFPACSFGRSGAI